MKKSNKKSDYVQVIKEDTDIKYSYSHLTLDKLEEHLVDIFKSKKEVGKRKVMGIRGCSTHGTIDISDFCGSPTCHLCNDFAKSFHEYVKENVIKEN